MAVVTIAALKAKYQTGDFPTEQDFIDLIDTLDNGSTSVSKKYVALLSQAGVNAPVATVIYNTLGGNVVWTYTSAGVYTGTLSGAFTQYKTVVFLTNGGSLFEVNAYWYSANEVQIYTANNAMVGASIEIRVYS